LGRLSCATLSIVVAVQRGLLQPVQHHPMSSMWALVFSCCIRARPSQGAPHEHTPLIRDTEYAPTPPLPRIIDHQKMKERLSDIVRSKEG